MLSKGKVVKMGISCYPLKMSPDKIKLTVYINDIPAWNIEKPKGLNTGILPLTEPIIFKEKDILSLKADGNCENCKMCRVNFLIEML